MYTTELVSQLKKTNVSVDAEKTKARVEALWKAAKREQKAQILALADVVRATLYRVYETGGISAKLVVAMAQVLNVSPAYLTGASDDLASGLENGECSDAVISAFLTEKGYQKIVAKHPTIPVQNKRKRMRRASDRKAAAVIALEESGTISPAALPAAPSGLSDDEMVVLLRALLIKARTDDAAAITVETIRRCVLS